MLGCSCCVTETDVHVELFIRNNQLLLLPDNNFLFNDLLFLAEYEEELDREFELETDSLFGGFRKVRSTNIAEILLLI